MSNLSTLGQSQSFHLQYFPRCGWNDSPNLSVIHLFIFFILLSHTIKASYIMCTMLCGTLHVSHFWHVIVINLWCPSWNRVLIVSCQVLRLYEDHRHERTANSLINHAYFSSPKYTIPLKCARPISCVWIIYAIQIHCWSIYMYNYAASEGKSEINAALHTPELSLSEMPSVANTPVANILILINFWRETNLGIY